jgi:hypothetical protein
VPVMCQTSTRSRVRFDGMTSVQLLSLPQLDTGLLARRS